MTPLATTAQLLIALGIFNVWLIRARRSTPYRPEGANNLSEEFARYGLSNRARMAVGAAKLSLAGLLLVGLVVPEVAAPAAGGMALLMLGAVLAHVRVKDPVSKAMPAFTMLLLSATVIVSRLA